MVIVKVMVNVLRQRVPVELGIINSSWRWWWCSRNGDGDIKSNGDAAQVMSASWTEHHQGDGHGDDGGHDESLNDYDDGGGGDDVNNLKIPVKATNSKVGTSLIGQCVVVDYIWS